MANWNNFLGGLYCQFPNQYSSGSESPASFPFAMPSEIQLLQPTTGNGAVNQHPDFHHQLMYPTNHHQRVPAMSNSYAHHHLVGEDMQNLHASQENMLSNSEGIQQPFGGHWDIPNRVPLLTYSALSKLDTSLPLSQPEQPQVSPDSTSTMDLEPVNQFPALNSERRHQGCTCCQNKPSKVFVCHLCGSTFQKSSHFKAHIRKHNNIRPYQCSVCPKNFIRSDDLTRHKKTHTGVKEYHCPTCAKSFGRSDHLKKHIKIHEKKK